MNNNVLVGASSSSNLDKFYYDEAYLIGDYLAKKGYNLVCGCVCGLMNSVSLAFKNNGMSVQIMETKNDLVDYYPYSMQLFPSVCDRKKALYNNVSLAVFLPGGIGTFDELFGAIESNRCKDVSYPVIIVNINHYYDNLLLMLETMYKESFANEGKRNLYSVVSNINELELLLEFKNIKLTRKNIVDNY